MKRVPKVSVATAHAVRVGAAELRANLAKYLKRAKSGRPVVIQQRGRSAYVLQRFEDGDDAPAFGCVRDPSDYVAGAVLDAPRESWSAGSMP